MENTATFSPVSYADFKAEAERRGFVEHKGSSPKTFWKYSGTGYKAIAKNGIRVEFQNTRGGVIGVGYANPIPKMETVFKALSANPPEGLTFIGKITRSFNYRATTLEAFFNLVDKVGAVSLPASVREINAPASSAPALVPFAGSEKKVKNPVRSIALDSPEGVEATAKALAAIEGKGVKRA